MRNYTEQNFFLHTINKFNKPDLTLIPSEDVTTLSYQGKVFLQSTDALIELSKVDIIIWSLIHQKPTLSSLEEQALDKLNLSNSYSEFIENIIRSLYQTKLIRIIYKNELIEIKSWKPGSIRTAHFSVTSRCNLRCIHCLISQQELPELTNFEILSCIEQLADLGTEQINFSGGEVFTRLDFVEIIKYARANNIVVSMNSNGILINEEKARYLAEIGIDTVAISLYGTTPEVHELVTAKAGSFNATVRAIKLLRSLGINVAIKTMVMKHNYAFMQSLKEFANQLGCTIVFDPHIFPKQNGNSEPLSHQLSDSKMLEVMKNYTHLSQLQNNRIFMTPICPAGQDRIAIGTYGEVYPCTMFPIVLGNVKDTPIKEILDKSPLLKDFQSHSVLDIHECSECKLNKMCSICPGAAYIENGNYLSVSQRSCILSKAKYSFG